MKVAWLYAQQFLGGLFGARDLVAMATRDAAAILRWHKALGTLEPSKRADMVVIDGKVGDPYEALIKAKETSIRLVMINGVARYGIHELMNALCLKGQALRVSGEKRHLFLEQESGDPDVANVSLSAARTALQSAFSDLPKLARVLERPKPIIATRVALDAEEPVVWSLALDEIHATGVDLRPRLPFNSPRDFTGPTRAVAGAALAMPPLSTILTAIRLDPLTVADDADFLDAIEQQPNVPPPIKNGLRALY